MKTPSIRGRFGRVRRYTKLAVPPEASVTQQQFKDECDMNRIVKNAMRGIPSRFATHGVAQYGDFSEIPDLTALYNVVARAEEAFMTLPAELRLELGNDPANINHLTQEQLVRYRLTKEPQPAPDALRETQPVEHPHKPSKKASKAGQAATSGTEPDDA